ncbi:MAG: ATP-binding cassette domain-containing protein [Phycisphaerae bacterium]|nr:ATP-binding cassette domain-containing protein [Phycisphaerae bacterium]
MLEVRNLSLRFPNFSLRRVGFSVAVGEYFVLFGPTGSGKTLLLELIAGLRRPDEGTVVINGVNRTFADPSVRRIGYVPQDLALIPFKTVWKNMAFGLSSRPFRPAGKSKRSDEGIRERIEEMLAMLKIEHLAQRMPSSLSGGEKQRVALGRALVVQPDLLLLDEPLSAVDENTGDVLMREIRALQRRLGITTLHICHRREEMRFLADRVGVLRDGEMTIHNPSEI